MMQFLFIEFFLRCDTKFVLSGMIFRLNSATVASEETKKSEMENSTINHKRNHIFDPNLETSQSKRQFKQLRNDKQLKK